MHSTQNITTYFYNSTYLSTTVKPASKEKLLCVTFVFRLHFSVIILTMPPKTTDYIKKDSPKYIERSSSMAKTGSKTNDTHAAHKLGVGLTNAILTNSAGRPHSEKTKKTISKELNDGKNLRIKSASTNLIDDERNDGKIAKCVIEGGSLKTEAEKQRLRQAMEGAKTLSTDTITNKLGDVRIYDRETGGYKKAKNIL